MAGSDLSGLRVGHRSVQALYVSVHKGTCQAMLYNDKILGGIPFAVKDARIWAEIKYLDSDTDYREYICCERCHQRLSLDDMVCLDTSGPLVPTWTLSPQLLVGIVFLAAAWMLYLFVQGL